MADHAADVIGLLDARDIRDPIPVGHSFGGLLALYMAAHFPERFPRIVVLDAAIALATPSTRALLKSVLDRLSLTFPSWEAYLTAVKQTPFFQFSWDPALERYFRADLRENPDRSVQSRARPEAIGAAIEGILIEDWPALLAKIQQPVLLFNAQGPYGPPARRPSSRVTRRWPPSRRWRTAATSRCPAITSR